MVNVVQANELTIYAFDWTLHCNGLISRYINYVRHHAIQDHILIYTAYAYTVQHHSDTVCQHKPH